MTGKPHTVQCLRVMSAMCCCAWLNVKLLETWSSDHSIIRIFAACRSSAERDRGLAAGREEPQHPALPVAVTTCPHPHQTWGDHTSHQSPHLHAFIHENYHDIHYSFVQSVQVLVSVNKASRWNVRYLREFDGWFNVPKMIHYINWMAWHISVIRKLVVRYTVLFWPGLLCTFNKFLRSNHFLQGFIKMILVCFTFSFHHGISI